MRLRPKLLLLLVAAALLLAGCGGTACGVYMNGQESRKACEAAPTCPQTVARDGRNWSLISLTCVVVEAAP